MAKINGPGDKIKKSSVRKSQKAAAKAAVKQKADSSNPLWQIKGGKALKRKVTKAVKRGRM
jgi:hypothetical protein